ncbi:unnamed protein product [Effrenium voratum]|nr:unnamed protein product [Effrenium voratum]
MHFFGTERKIKKYAKKRNAGIIGEGVVAFPPCEPQPFCAILEVLGKKIAGVEEDCGVPPEVAALLLPTGQPGHWRRRRGAKSAFLELPGAGDLQPLPELTNI